MRYNRRVYAFIIFFGPILSALAAYYLAGRQFRAFPSPSPTPRISPSR